eukprot:TRINITY_DN78783_c0_g1_i1.p1 TRINITY_DN78783_c0_g1~~TRINITY_DN78783_c0_g1_i1.p1  ORF type:complete len:318 (-),score=26.34 TRINITY_DN78783_c0_g1_i1:264-1217(-)
MPHRIGDPIPRLSENQKKVYKAYGSIPIWLDEHNHIVCQYCNGAKACEQSCLLSGVMDNMRKDIEFLDAEDSRLGIPVTHEELKDNFRLFCGREDVAALVSGDRLYEDFVDMKGIVLVLQSLGPWLISEAQRYAEAGGVHNQPRDRLALKCTRAVTLFLRLDLNALSHEDTIILSNVVESSGVMEDFDPVMQSNIQIVMDLLSIAHAFREMQGKDGGLKALLMGAGAPASSDSTGVVSRGPSNAAGAGGRSQPARDSKNFEDDPSAPRRCHGKTQSGARCKLTEESVHKLHGRCADAARPLARGAKYCKFHRDQQFM